MNLKTSDEWYSEIPKEFKFAIMDPDGWDRKNYDFSFCEEKISKQEFLRRCSHSTVIHHVSMHDWMIEWSKIE